MNSKLLLSISLFLFIALCASAQVIPENRVVIIKTEEDLSKVEVAINPRKIRLIKDRFYYSYYNDQIYKSRYGSSYFGHLLNGRYENFYSQSKAIKEKGQFNNGLKIGVWKTWYPDGQLNQIQHWKKGNQHGKFKEYDPNGRLTKSGNYRNGLLHGKISTFQNGVLLDTIKYKKGKVKVAKVKVDKKKRKKKKKKKKKERKKKDKESQASTGTR